MCRYMDLDACTYMYMSNQEHIYPQMVDYQSDQQFWATSNRRSWL